MSFSAIVHACRRMYVCEHMCVFVSVNEYVFVYVYEHVCGRVGLLGTSKGVESQDLGTPDL